MRWSCLVNGAAITMGAALVVDNVVFHWTLGWHRLAPYYWTGLVEVASFIVGVALVAWGAHRERRQSRGEPTPRAPPPL